LLVLSLNSRFGIVAGLAKRKPEETIAIRKNLLAYCRLDTLAMVKILEKLREIAASPELESATDTRLV
jgi:hypothetical protein